MRWSAPISALIHAAILVSAVVALPDPEEFEVKTSEAVPVEILTEEDIPKPKQPEKPPEEVKKLEPPKPDPPKPKPKTEVAALPPKPEPEPERKPDPVEKPPESKPVEEKPPEPKPEAKPEKPKEPKVVVKKNHPLPKPKPKVRRRKAENTKRFDDQINDLLNKIPDETPPQPQLPEQTETTETASADNYLQNGTQLEREEIAAIIRARMRECWQPNPASENAHWLKVTIKLKFKPNGELSGGPENQTPVSDSLTRAEVERAQRALIRCAPYVLPAESYDVWKDMVLTFRPSSMF